MPWFRFIAIISLKWIANILSVIILSFYVIPQEWQGYTRAALFWFLSFVIAFVFAEWAMRRLLPGRRVVVLLLSLWLFLSLLYQMLYGYVSLENVYAVLNSFDTYIQFLLESIALVLAARSVRQQKLAQVAGEGMEA